LDDVLFRGIVEKEAVSNKVAIDVVGWSPASFRIQLGNIYK